jgi:hypothetical protein
MSATRVEAATAFAERQISAGPDQVRVGDQSQDRERAPLDVPTTPLAVRDDRTDRRSRQQSPALKTSPRRDISLRYKGLP